ncbi:hypothetical protein VQ056_30215 [Paenibacillus sp. JTLBN-2024]
MKPRSPFKVVCMMMAACFLLASCSRNSEPAKVGVAQKKDVWSQAEVTRENIKLVLEKPLDEGAIPAAQIKDIQLQGANNKTVTVDLKHESPDPDRLMSDAAATLISYSGILLENKGIGTVEVCLYGNPEPANGKNVTKETVWPSRSTARICKKGRTPLQSRWTITPWFSGTQAGTKFTLNYISRFFTKTG